MRAKYLDLNEVKQFLRLEPDYIEEDIEITMLMLAAESYIEAAVDNIDYKINSSHVLASYKLLAYTLIVDWYENREFSSTQNDKVKFTIQTLLLQLKTAPIVREREENTYE